MEPLDWVEPLDGEPTVPDPAPPSPSATADRAPLDLTAMDHGPGPDVWISLDANDCLQARDNDHPWGRRYVDARKLEAEREAVERRMSDLLDTVELPASVPMGAPGSLQRRAWEIGQSLADHIRGERAAHAETKRERDEARAAVPAIVAWLRGGSGAVYPTKALAAEIERRWGKGKEGGGE